MDLAIELSRGRRGRRRRQLPVLALLALSLLGHAVLFCFARGVQALTAGPVPKRMKRAQVALRTLDSRQWAMNRGAAASSSSPTVRPFTMPKGQIVDVPQGNKIVPKESKYLAESNNSVEHETRAEKQVAAPGMAGTHFTTAGLAKRPVSRPTVRSAARGGEVGLQDRFAAMDGPSYHSKLSQLLRGDGPAPPPPNGGVASSEGEQADAPTGATAGAIGSGASGAANDDLKDVQKGQGTYLNTREWVYAGFFNRVKQAVSAHWDPNQELKHRDPQGRQLGYSGRVTVISVTLDTSGAIKDLFVAQSSGVDFLDAEAMRAFQRAAPFANPPAAIFSGHDYFRFEFGFHLEMNGSAFSPGMFRPGER